MLINISLDVDEKISKTALAEAIRQAADRAAGQIEYDILPHPLPMDETIDLGADGPLVYEVSIFRSE